MKDEARRTYRGFSTFFLATGAVFLGLSMLRFTPISSGLRGDPLWVALLLIGIGGLLRWTVRRRPHEDAEPEATPDDANGGQDKER
ncbi:MAG: hypothetical protein U5K81_04420 [Trueperaceae bacterium]|nr:hypothetical protein [Trueperaceae bacterium]